jgi:hypothetical protein
VNRRPPPSDRNRCDAVFESQVDGMSAFDPKQPFARDSSRHTPAPPSHAPAARTRPATARTRPGAARQMANAESSEQPMATQNAIA